MSGGLSQLAAGSAQLRSGVTQLGTGMGTYQAGLKQYTDGVTGILTPLPQQVDLLMGLRQIDDGLFAGGDLASYTSNANALTGTVTSTAASLSAASAAASTQAAGLNALTDTRIDAATAALACPASVGAPGSDACTGYAAGVAAAAAASKTAAASAVAATDGGGKSLAQNLATVSGGAGTLTVVAPKVAALVGGTTTLVATVDNIPSAAVLQPEKDGAAQLAAGGAPLVAGFQQLRAGVSQSLGGTLSLEYGITSYTAGVDQVAPGAAQISAGLEQMADGSPALLSGAQQYVSGVGQVLDGIDQAAPGATKLADGLKQSADGSAQLADGSKQLADGLAKGATQVPSYTTEDRTQLSKVVASPISISSLDELVQPGAALAALLMILALWAGAFATYTVLPAVRRRLALSSSPTAALVVEALRPGLLIVLAQALLVSAVGQAFVRLPAYRWLSLTVLLILAGVAFVAVNHALAAWAKGAGRIFGIAAAVVTAATALTSAVPGWLDVVRPLSPLSPAYDAVRAVVSGGPGVTTPVFTLIAWTLIGADFTVAAIVRARTVSPAALTAVA